MPPMGMMPSCPVAGRQLRDRPACIPTAVDRALAVRDLAIVAVVELSDGRSVRVARHLAPPHRPEAAATPQSARAASTERPLATTDSPCSLPNCGGSGASGPACAACILRA